MSELIRLPSTLNGTTMRSFLVLACLLAIVSQTFGFVHSGAFRTWRASGSGFPMAELDTGDFEGVNFVKTGWQSDKVSNIGLYDLKAVVKAKEMNVYLDEYKDEMKKRKVVFPGFRAGKLPPYVMGDVRKYIVSFGLENLLGQLANINNLQLVNEDGSDVPFGEDEYYGQIIKEDERGYDFEKLRDNWREGTDLIVNASFYAINDEGGDDEQGQPAGGSESESTDADASNDDNVIDVEAIDVVEAEEAKEAEEAEESRIGF